jgi:hypothetical protein
MGDVISLSTTKASQVISESLDKDGKIQTEASIRFYGTVMSMTLGTAKGRKYWNLNPTL